MRGVAAAATPPSKVRLTIDKLNKVDKKTPAMLGFRGAKRDGAKAGSLAKTDEETEGSELGFPKVGQNEDDL